jgi:hypothetical protein
VTLANYLPDNIQGKESQQPNVTKNDKILCLFDVDGTLTPARKVVAVKFILLLTKNNLL